MRYPISYIAIVAFSIAIPRFAPAQQPAATDVTDADIAKAVGAGMPAQIQVTTTPEDKKQSAYENCIVQLPAVGYSKQYAEKCCKEDGCPARAMKKAQNQRSAEDNRAAINMRRCLKDAPDSDKERCKSDRQYAYQVVKKLNDTERQCLSYGYGKVVCSDPTTAKQAIEEYNLKQQTGSQAPTPPPSGPTAEELERERVAKMEKACVDAGGDKLRCQYSSYADEILKKKAERDAPVGRSGDYSDTRRRSNFLELGISLVGKPDGGGINGAWGGGARISYRPPISVLGEDRFAFTLTGAALVVTKNRLQLGNNVDPISRGYVEGNLSFRVFSGEEFAFALGGSYGRLGRFSLDRKTAEFVGPTAMLKLGALILEGKAVYNFGPPYGYLSPGWGSMFVVSFNFLDTNLWGPSKYHR